MDRFVRRMMFVIFFSLVAIGAVVAIWEAIPGIVKALAIVGIIIGSVKLLREK